MKGCYCLIIKLKKDSTIRIGKKLGKIEFNQGYYVYVGSAMNSLIARIERHLSDDKKMHWHVDYLLKKAEISDVIYNQSKRKIECDLSRYISKQAEGIKDFGCSDCECESHLYYFKTKKEAVECVEKAYNSINMEYEYY
ncbi:GIY-YIG nuclease family protein [Methanobrevibacter sp.]|uniref:GIY-YIG nuclease family protein n=1 Tax=Methanobrevibacter sp. TaxID=66852 RepID=UPI00388F549A